jgi:hypothetical protein
MGTVITLQPGIIGEHAEGVASECGQRIELQERGVKEKKKKNRSEGVVEEIEDSIYNSCILVISTSCLSKLTVDFRVWVTSTSVGGACTPV